MIKITLHSQRIGKMTDGISKHFQDLYRSMPTKSCLRLQDTLFTQTTIEKMENYLYEVLLVEVLLCQYVK
jgi:hypothetical protein